MGTRVPSAMSTSHCRKSNVLAVRRPRVSAGHLKSPAGTTSFAKRTCMATHGPARAEANSSGGRTKTAKRAGPQSFSAASVPPSLTTTTRRMHGGSALPLIIPPQRHAPGPVPHPAAVAPHAPDGAPATITPGAAPVPAASTPHSAASQPQLRQAKKAISHALRPKRAARACTRAHTHTTTPPPSTGLHPNAAVTAAATSRTHRAHGKAHLTWLASARARTHLLELLKLGASLGAASARRRLGGGGQRRGGALEPLSARLEPGLRVLDAKPAHAPPTRQTAQTGNRTHPLVNLLARGCRCRCPRGAGRRRA